MTVILEIPDPVADSWCRNAAALPGMVLAAAAVEAYRQGRLSTAEVGRLLGHSSRWETEDFLAAHQAWPDPTEEEIIAGAEALKHARLP